MQDAAACVEHGHHAANGKREELVDARSNSVVWCSHGFGARDAREEEVCLLRLGEARGACDDRYGRFRRHVLSENRRLLLARQADHPRLHGGPLVKHGQILDDVVRGQRWVVNHLLVCELSLATRVLVRVDKLRRHAKAPSQRGEKGGWARR